jgi:hypothetical protein
VVHLVHSAPCPAVCQTCEVTLRVVLIGGKEPDSVLARNMYNSFSFLIFFLFFSGINIPNMYTIPIIV